MTDNTKNPPKPKPDKPIDFGEKTGGVVVVDTLKPPPRPQDRSNNNDKSKR